MLANNRTPLLLRLPLLLPPPPLLLLLLLPLPLPLRLPQLRLPLLRNLFRRRATKDAP